FGRRRPSLGFVQGPWRGPNPPAGEGPQGPEKGEQRTSPAFAGQPGTTRIHARRKKRFSTSVPASAGAPSGIIQRQGPASRPKGGSRSTKINTANEINGVDAGRGIQEGGEPAAAAPPPPPAERTDPRRRPVPSVPACGRGGPRERRPNLVPHVAGGRVPHGLPSGDRAAAAQAGQHRLRECEINALSDLFHQFAKNAGSGADGDAEEEDEDAEDEDAGSAPYLCEGRIRLLLESIGERPSDATFRMLVGGIDSDRDGRVTLEEFLSAADLILGRSPARVVLVVGGPGSGKGALCERLAAECGAVHLSCGAMLREEAESGTPLGREVAGIMERGELVSSATVTALMRRRMRAYPGRRILLDGFPRSLENARDFVELCGPPELALHLDCDDTVLLERILDRGERSAEEARRAEEGGLGAPPAAVRADDNVRTAISRLRTYHRHHGPTMQWLREMKVPVVELDCSGSKEDVWGHLSAVGRLMRPAVRVPRGALEAGVQLQQQQQRQQQVQEQQEKSQGADKGDMEWVA
ncbi:hypothetical protein THAOC_09232, partial [Thalassiosira oceanica]